MKVVTATLRTTTPSDSPVIEDPGPRRGRILRPHHVPDVEHPAGEEEDRDYRSPALDDQAAENLRDILVQTPGYEDVQIVAATKAEERRAREAG